MAYLVNITRRAERDFASRYRTINAEESYAALKWYRGFKAAILSLEERPNRWPKTPENSALRHLLYGDKPHEKRAEATSEALDTVCTTLCSHQALSACCETPPFFRSL